jgi:hypothetical protein
MSACAADDTWGLGATLLELLLGFTHGPPLSSCHETLLEVAVGWTGAWGALWAGRSGAFGDLMAEVRGLVVYISAHLYIYAPLLAQDPFPLDGTGTGTV